MSWVIKFILAAASQVLNHASLYWKVNVMGHFSVSVSEGSLETGWCSQPRALASIIMAMKSILIKSSSIKLIDPILLVALTAIYTTLKLALPLLINPATYIHTHHLHAKNNTEGASHCTELLRHRHNRIGSYLALG